MIAAAAAGQLLVGKIDRAMRRATAGGGEGIGVRGVGDGREMKIAGKDGAVEASAGNSSAARSNISCSAPR